MDSGKMLVFIDFQVMFSIAWYKNNLMLTDMMPVN